jgi:Tfp pilus assembly protein PilP
MKSLSNQLRAMALASCIMLSVQFSFWWTPVARAANPDEPVQSEEAIKLEEPTQVEQMTAPQVPAPMGAARSSGPSEASIQVQKELLQQQFAYNPKSLVDPFKPFIAPAEAPPALPTVDNEDLDVPPPEPQRPLTPLQRMRISEIEAGLKAIMWGPLGRRAMIEDAAGKGYIVSVGTPIGERNGVVSEIFNDHLVIQQEYWDKREKRMVPQNVMVKLKKASKQ